MKRYKISILSFLAMIFILFIVYILNVKRINQIDVFRVLERVGIRQNELDLQFDDSFRDVKIVWVGYKNSDRLYASLLVYGQGKVKSKIPDAYGKNYLLVFTDNLVYNKIGILKLKSWYKHKYIINLEHHNKLLIIKWKVSNRYESFSDSDEVIIR